MDIQRMRRIERIEILERAYGARKYFDNEPAMPHAFCAVWREDRKDAGQCWATFDSFDEAADHLAGDSLDGGVFEAIFDLDTGERIDLHISTPIVTRSEEQGILINPLQPDEEEEDQAVVIRFVANVSPSMRPLVEAMLRRLVLQNDDVTVSVAASYPPGGPPEAFIANTDPLDPRAVAESIQWNGL